MPLCSRGTSMYSSVIMLLALLATSRAVRVSDIGVPTYAISGSSVQLTCNYEQRKERPDPVYSVKWYRGVDQFYEYIPKNNPPVRIFPLPYMSVQEHPSDKSSVVLKGIKKESTGTYRCEVMGDKPHFETDDDGRNMTVLEIPRWGPEIQGLTDGMRILPGDVVKARCLVGFSDPPVDISWRLNSQELPENEPLPQSIPQDESIQASEIKFPTSEETFKRGAMTISCEAKLFDVFHKSFNVTLIHALQPQPAEFGWFSRGAPRTSALLVPTVVTVLCVTVL